MLEKTLKIGRKVFRSGDHVEFLVENQDQWGGDNEGYILYITSEKDWFVSTENSGILTIDNGYDVYSGTIKKIK